MSGDPKELARGLSVDTGTGYALIKDLVLDGFFYMPVSSGEVVARIGERYGKRWGSSKVQVYMKKFMPDIIQAIKPKGSKLNYWALASLDRQEAVRAIGKSKRVIEIEHQLFSEALLKKLGAPFAVEVGELHDNFGKNGNSTAFLLRKILEKLLIITFGKLGRSALIEDQGRPGRWKGLDELIRLATTEKVNGIPILLARTGTQIQGIKFLGDASAHNPLASVDTSTILPQMPFIITAYEELSKHL